MKNLVKILLLGGAAIGAILIMTVYFSHYTLFEASILEPIKISERVVVYVTEYVQ
jgi:hypothetical protein